MTLVDRMTQLIANLESGDQDFLNELDRGFLEYKKRKAAQLRAIDESN